MAALSADLVITLASISPLTFSSRPCVVSFVNCMMVPWWRAITSEFNVFNTQIEHDGKCHRAADIREPQTAGPRQGCDPK